MLAGQPTVQARPLPIPSPNQMVDDKLTVSELMTTSMIALPPVVPVRRLVDTLRMCNHQVCCFTVAGTASTSSSNITCLVAFCLGPG